jgi:hypothetical protein
MEFKHVPEPQLSELLSYVRQRRDHIHCFHTTADVRAELIKNITDQVQPVDSYPKGRQHVGDDEYVLVIRDMLNLSNILDDMEQTGWVPYQNRSQYYNLYCKLHRLLIGKVKS